MFKKTPHPDILPLTSREVFRASSLPSPHDSSPLPSEDTASASDSSDDPKTDSPDAKPKPPADNVVVLQVPTKAEFRQEKASFKGNKDSLWGKISRFVTLLNVGKLQFEWEGDPEMVKLAQEVQATVCDKRFAALKDTLLDFYGMLFASPVNTDSILKIMIPGKGLALARYIVEKGAISLNSIYSFMGWKQKVPEPHYYTRKPEPNLFETSSETEFLASVCRKTVATAEPEFGKKWYDKDYFYLPEPSLIKFILRNNSVKIPPVDDIPENFTIFSGKDFPPSSPIIENLILSKTVEPSKTKVGLNAIKKMKSLVPLAEFPPLFVEVPSRSAFMTNLSMFALGAFSLKSDAKTVEIEDFMRAAFKVLDMNYITYDQFVFGTIMTGLTKDFFLYCGVELKRVVSHVFLSLQEIADGKWWTFGGFNDLVNMSLADKGYSYFIQDSYSGAGEGLAVDGKSLPLSLMKKYLHDYTILSTILGAASIGAVDFAVNSQGDLSFIRLTEMGKWLLRLTKKFPDIYADLGDIGQVFSDDAETGLILVTDPTSPLAPLITDFADKVTDSRYVISESKFLSDCGGSAALKEKIKRFKTFIIRKPGAKIEATFDRMLHNCNKVKKDSFSNCYELFDIDPSDTRLHAIILRSPEIRGQILKVEKSKILVISSFVSKFKNILRKEGYLNDF